MRESSVSACGVDCASHALLFSRHLVLGGSALRPDLAVGRPRVIAVHAGESGVAAKRRERGDDHPSEVHARVRTRRRVVPRHLDR